MDLVFNKCYAAPNQVNKYDYYSGEDLVISGTFRGECDIVNPVFLVEYDVLKIKDYNYILVYDLKRFYFINNIVIINNNLVEIYCSEDILTSCWYFSESGLRELNVFVDRSETYVNEYLPDELLPVRSVEPLRFNALSNTTVDIDFSDAYGAYNYIITVNVAGTKSYTIKDKFSTYANAHFICNKITLNNFCNSIMKGENWFNGSNPYESVISIHYCAIKSVQTYLPSVRSIAHNTDYEMELSGNSVEFYVEGDFYAVEGSCSIVFGGYVNTDFNNPNFDEIPRFLLNDTYSRCTVEMPLAGVIPIDSQYVLGDISYMYNCDLNSMTASLVMTSSIGGKFFEKSGLSFGISLPFSGSNSLEITRNLVLGGVEFAVGLGLASVTGGASLALSGSGMMTAASTTKETKINRGKSGNVTSIKTAESEIPSVPTTKGLVAGYANYISKSVIGAVQSSVKKTYYSSSSFDCSSVTYLYFDVIELFLLVPWFYIPNHYYSLLGGPCSTSGALSTFRGYTLISGFHLSNIHGLNLTEMNMLNDILRSGIILPRSPSTYTSKDSGNSEEEFKVYSEDSSIMPVVDNEGISVYSEEGIKVNQEEVNSEQSTQIDSEEVEQSEEEIEVGSEQLAMSEESTQVDIEEVEQIEMSEESYKEMVLRKLSE